MALPAGWPPRVSSGVRSIRFYATGTLTSTFSDNAFLFSLGTGANTFTALPYVPPGGERTNVVIPTPPVGGGRDAHDSNAQPTNIVAPPPPTMIWAQGIRISNESSGLLEFSFDGTNVHGAVQTMAQAVYLHRYEAGIAVKGAGIFRIEAW